MQRMRIVQIFLRQYMPMRKPSLDQLCRVPRRLSSLLRQVTMILDWPHIVLTFILSGLAQNNLRNCICTKEVSTASEPKSKIFLLTRGSTGLKIGCVCRVCWENND